MKLCVKKIFCPYCRRLVRCSEQESNGLTRVTCPSCGKLLYVWNGVYWRTVPAQ